MNEETFHTHICQYLREHFGYQALSAIADKAFPVVEQQLFSFIKVTQPEAWQALEDEYFGSDTGHQIIKAIKEELLVSPLWLIMRNGISIKNQKLLLYFPRPRNQQSPELNHTYQANIFAYKKEFYFADDTSEAIDLVLFLNGLPIITVELKHAGTTGEASTYLDAIEQYAQRRQQVSKIFSMPFAHFAADTDETYIANNPSKAENFKPFNTGLSNLENPNRPATEYPVWHLYGQVFSPEYICDFIEYFLVYVPKKLDQAARTIIPRFHQLRSTRNLTADLMAYTETHDTLGKKYLIHHSPGAGKTFTISWLAERLDSLYKTTTGEKVFDTIFILTDRKNLDKNIKDDLENFTHLQQKIVFTDKANDVLEHIKKRTNIIVTTIQKFSYVQEKLSKIPTLAQLKVAFLIDEAHRSQGGKMGMKVRSTFTDEATETEEETTIEDSIAEVFEKLDISRQVYVAFTATPTEKTMQLFGKPFDIYTEDEAIKEDYILDVAENIISYKTLYNLNTIWVKPDTNLYPEGLINKLLRDIAYEDENIIQYKSTVIIEHFENEVRQQLNGKAKTMVVASSRQAGYHYFLALRTILSKKRLPYKVLFAFTDFIDKTSKQPLNEANVNDIVLGDETPIESYFEKDEYKILIVANKFQQGFDEPLLCAMYLDKIVKGVNAVQTISRLNRKAPNKNKTTVIDFTNNAKEIFKAFSKYRKGAKVRETEPNPEELQALYEKIADFQVFNEDMIQQYIQTAKENNDAIFMALSLAYRTQFEKTISDKEQRKTFVNLLSKFVKQYNFFAQFVNIPEHLSQFALFCDLIKGKLIKIGSESSLKKSLESVVVEKAAVKFLGEIQNPNIIKEPTTSGGNGSFEPTKVTIEDVIANIKAKFLIETGEEIIIREIYEEALKNNGLAKMIYSNRENQDFLQHTVAIELKKNIINAYRERGMFRKTREAKYKDMGGIFDLMVQSIIRKVIFKG